MRGPRSGGGSGIVRLRWLSDLEHLVEALRCSTVEVVWHVGVETHGERRVGMAKSGLDDPGVLSTGDHEARRDVSEAVEAQGAVKACSQ